MIKKMKIKIKHKIVLLNSFGIAIIFLETLHFIGSLNLAIGISLIVIGIAITGFIIAEIREEARLLKEYLESLKNKDG